MPHIILECSNNIIEQDLSSLLLEIHQLLSECLPTELPNCKSRVLRHSEYLVADGSPEQAFVHLQISVLKGRSTELLTNISTNIMEKLQAAFAGSAKLFNLQLSIATNNLPEVYLKMVLPQ